MLETFGCQHIVEANFTTRSLESSDAFLPAANRTQHNSRLWVLRVVALTENGGTPELAVRKSTASHHFRLQFNTDVFSCYLKQWNCKFTAI